MRPESHHEVGLSSSVRCRVPGNGQRNSTAKDQYESMFQHISPVDDRPCCPPLDFAVLDLCVLRVDTVLAFKPLTTTKKSYAHYQITKPQRRKSGLMLSFYVLQDPKSAPNNSVRLCSAHNLPWHTSYEVQLDWKHCPKRLVF